MQMSKMIIGIISCIALIGVYFVSPVFVPALLIATRTLVELFTYDFIVGTIGPWQFNLQAVTGIVFILFSISYLLKKKKNRNIPIVNITISFFVVAIISLLFSRHLSIGVRNLFRWLQMFLLIIYIISSVKYRRDINIIVSAGAIASIIPIAISLYGIISGNGTAIFFAPPDVARIGWYSPGNPTGLILMGLFPFLLFKSIQVRKGIINIYSLGCILSIAGIYFTFMRTALLALLVFVAVFLILSRSKKYFILFGVSAVVIVILSLTVPGSAAKDVIVRRTNDIQVAIESKSISSLGNGRVWIWEKNMGYWAQQPILKKILGSGIGNNIDATGSAGSHDDFLMLLLDVGILGLVLYIWFLAMILKQWIKLMKRSQTDYYRYISYCGLSLFSAFIVMSCVNGQLQMMQSQLYIASFLALGPAAQNILNKEENI